MFRAAFVSLLPALLLGAPSYHRDIRPILQRDCQGCHQPASKQGNLDLTSYAALKAGGKHGADPAIILKYLTGELKPQMPLGQKPLTPDQITLFRDWIAAGARDDTPAEAEPTGPISYTQPPVITALAFSPDARHIAVSAYREVVIAPATGGAPVQRLAGKSERIHSLAFSPDGKLLLAAGGTPARFGEMQIWDTAAAKLRHAIELTGDTLFGASLSPDAKYAAAGAADNTVRIIDVAAAKEIHKIGNHENWVLGTVFGRDGKRVVSVGRDRAAKLTETSTGAFLENVNLLRGELAAVARHPSKDIVVIGGDDRYAYVYLMDRPKNMKIADDTTMLRKLDRQDGAIFALAWSPDGKQIAIAGASPEVNLYDADTGRRIAACKGHTAGIYALAYSPTGDMLATGGFDGSVRIYNTATAALLHDFIPVPISKTEVARQ